MIDAVRLAFAAVRSREIPDGDQLTVVPLEGATQVMVGIDAQRHAHVLLPRASDSPAPTALNVNSLDVQTRPLLIAGDSEVFVDVSCNVAAAADVFEHFVAAVLHRATKLHEDPVAALNAVLGSWRDFFRPSSGPPSRDKVAALLAELFVLRDLAREGAAAAASAWMGPSGARHDFRRGSDALEVKMTRAHTSRQVTIHGEDQLEPPEGGQLFLHFVRLEETPDEGESLPSVVDEILALEVTAEAMYRSLGEAGMSATHLSALADVRFQVRERFTVPVDTDTPRIVPGSFASGARPKGVVELSYAIDLDREVDRSLPDADYAQLVRRLGGKS